MSEDFGNVEADLEALIAALELAGVIADRARQTAVRLSDHVRREAPRSRKDWQNRAQLESPNGDGLGWLDTSKARRVDMNESSGIEGHKDRDQVRGGARKADTGQLMELEGQFFEVKPSQVKGKPEQVRPISGQEAQERMAERRPDLNMRMGGEDSAHLGVSRSTDAEPARVEQSGPGSSDSGVRQERGADNPQTWAEPASAAGSENGPRSAAAAFGAVDPGRAHEAELDGEPSIPELHAVGATKPAETAVSR